MPSSSEAGSRGEVCVDTGIRLPNCGCRRCNGKLFDDHAAEGVRNDPIPSYERITCDDVIVGDKIARAKTHVFQEVVEIREGPLSRRLCFTLPTIGARRNWGRNIRPGREALLWRQV